MADWKVEGLSKEMSQKVQFIATVIVRPQLLLLDVWTRSTRRLCGEILLELVRVGTTVVSTHDMAVAESMCDCIFNDHEGRKVLDGTLRQIQEQHGGDAVRPARTAERIRSRTSGPARGAADPKHAGAWRGGGRRFGSGFCNC